MADPLSAFLRPEPPPNLAVVSRLAPPPPANVIEAELEARSAPGDIVMDLHGRGGWVARAAIARLRRAYVFESNPLTRLLAEIVLRPPDVRHLDAAINSMAIQPRGSVGLRQALNDMFASRCATCERQVIVEEFIWDADAPAPSRKVYRCTVCRDQLGGGELRNEPTDADDARRASVTLPEAARHRLLGRFPVLDGQTQLPEQLLALYTPRSLVAIEAILERLEHDLRADPIDAALRLALLTALVPASKLNGYPGRVGTLRINQARVRAAREGQWREHNPWGLFEQGCAAVRGFLQRLEAGGGTHIHVRVGQDLLSLIDGSANLVVKRGSAALRSNAPSLPARPVSGAPQRAAGALSELPEPSTSGVGLVLTQPPPRWTTENLSFAYLGTAMVLGRDAAASLPLEAIYGAAPRAGWGWEALALRRSLAAVAPVLALDARVVVVLEPGGPEGLVAGALGGVGAGYRLSGALLAEAGDEIGGTLEFLPPVAPGSAKQLTTASSGEAHVPFQLAEVERAVTDLAVSVLQERGEPARFERLLGEVIVGLDRVGHLRRLVGTRSFAHTAARAERAAEAVGLFGELPASLREAADPPERNVAAADAPAGDEPAWRLEDGLGEARPRSDDRSESTAADVTDDDASADQETLPEQREQPFTRPGSDHVRLLLELVVNELKRPDHPRLQELEPGRWWLRDRHEIAAARLPLSDRVEWAVFSLLSTGGPLTEEAFYDRISGMFRGQDTPDEALVQACLESYRSAKSTPDALATDDDLHKRYAEHTDLIGLLVDYGHRLGLRCWINPHEQKRPFRGGTLGSLLSELEQRTYLPFVAGGSAEALEATDCVWYLRGKATFLFEVEWTAMLGEPLLRRGPQIRTDDHVVRFLVLLPERANLVRFKLDRSPLLRRALQLDNWHIIKANHLRTLVSSAEEANLERLAPFLGLDPDVELLGEQIPLFGG